MGFRIELTDTPNDYKDQITRIWLENLPDTPPSRYEWLTMGNPVGKTWWFLALEDNTKNLLGFITLLPRQFLWKGEEVLFGIMGDFVVDKRYRGFGPGLQLPSQVLKKARNLGFSLIYTIPYYGTIKHIERVGFKHKVYLQWLIKPLDSQSYVKNPIAAFSLNLAAYLFDRVCQSLFLNSSFLQGSNFEEVETIGNDFDEFWVKQKIWRKDIFGSRDSQYLRWRYLQNPFMKYRVLTLREQSSKDLIGYVIFTINGRKLDMFDIQYIQNKVKYLLVQKLIQIARKEGCEAIYILSSANDTSLSNLKLFAFFSSEEKHPLFYASLGREEYCLDTWLFLQNDRNV